MKAEGARACAERTLNMPSMSVTLDVSKLSGWLNFGAACQDERRACGAGRGAGWGRKGIRSDARSGTGDGKAWG